MKIYTTLFATLISIASFAQIEIKETPKDIQVGRIKSGAATIAELSYKIDGTDTIYQLLFDNAEYQHISDFQTVLFSGEDGTLDALYGVLKSVFSDENKKNKDYKVNIKLGETSVLIANFRTMGITSAAFFCPKGHFYMTEKQLDKLFGKN